MDRLRTNGNRSVFVCSYICFFSFFLPSPLPQVSSLFFPPPLEIVSSSESFGRVRNAFSENALVLPGGRGREHASLASAFSGAAKGNKNQIEKWEIVENTATRGVFTARRTDREERARWLLTRDA